jgi:hypothetical protein
MSADGSAEARRMYLFMGEIPELLERCRIYDDVGGGALPAGYDDPPRGCSCEAQGHPEAWRRVCFLACSTRDTRR